MGSNHSLDGTHQQCESGICPGRGLFIALRMVKKGGTVTTALSPYTSGLRNGLLIDGEPSGDADYAMFGCINEYIWDESRNNVALVSDGII